MAYKNDEDKKAYIRKHYLANKEYYKEKARVAKLKTRDFVKELKHMKPCSDCNVAYPYYVMQFDHTGTDKCDNVSLMANQGYSKKRILAEIAKCDLVCANCHAIRSYGRMV